MIWGILKCGEMQPDLRGGWCSMSRSRGEMCNRGHLGLVQCCRSQGGKY